MYLNINQYYKVYNERIKRNLPVDKRYREMVENAIANGIDIQTGMKIDKMELFSGQLKLILQK